MNILYLISYAGAAGTEKYVEQLMALYTAQGHICHLVYWQGGALSERAAAAGYPVRQMDLRPRRLLGAARELADYCRAREIDVIHAQYPRENAIAVLSRRWRETRVIFTAHLLQAQGPLWRALNRLLTPEDAAVTAVCEAGAAQLRANGVRPDRIRVLPNGLPPHPLPPRENAIREELALPADCFLFLALSRYAPEKGLDVLLKALALLRSRTAASFACVIAGEGEEFEKISALRTALGLEETVFQLGYRRDTRSLLCAADAYVSAARSEAMSFAALEAMSCGLPLVLTDVGAGAELARDCGRLVPPEDPEALAEAMQALCEDRPASTALGRRAWERVIEEYDLTALAQRLLALYSGE